MLNQRSSNPSVPGSNPSALTIGFWRNDAKSCDLQEVVNLTISDFYGTCTA